VGDLMGARLVADPQMRHVAGICSGASAYKCERRDQGHGQKNCSKLLHAYLHRYGLLYNE